MANEFMNGWNPKEMIGGDLILSNRGYGSTVTDIHSSEGDTLFIRQTSGTRIERVALTREELYDIVFNFMSGNELIKLAEMKLSQEFKNKS